MEMEILLRKEYSALPGLQESRSVQYILTRGTAGGKLYYGVRVTELGADWIEHGDYFPLTVCRPEAERVLTYLFENAVSAAHCQSVVSDLNEALDGSECNGEATHPALDCG